MKRERSPALRSRRSTGLLLIASTAAAVGCGGGQSLGTQDFGDTPIEFEPCPAGLPAAELGQCALVQVPVDWSRPSASERITVFLRRFRSPANPTGANQVWALDGGPGFAGDVFADPAIRDTILQAGYDLYIPTHRGTVYGTGPQCPDQQAPESDEGGRVTAAEFPACVAALRSQWGDNLALFDSRSAARDVRHLLERSRAASTGRVVVYGGSYGSYWGQRVLQVAPDLIAGVWLDSIVDLASSFERADQNSHDAGVRLLRACAADATCAARLSGDRASGEDLVDVIVARVTEEDRAGRGCGQKDRPLDAVQALFYRLLNAHPSEQALVAPLLARADRCSGADQAAIERAFTTLVETPPLPSGSGSGDARPPAYNPLLNRHIMLAELFRYDRTDADVAADSQRHLFSVRADQFMASIAPAYGPASHRDLPVDAPATGAHLVLWQGGIDPLDRIEWATSTADRWGAGRVSLVEVPLAGHSVVRYAVAEDGTRCATEMLRGFLADPAAELDRTCLDRMPDFDHAADNQQTRDAALRWFGVADAWGETAAARPPTPSADEPDEPDEPDRQ